MSQKKLTPKKPSPYVALWQRIINDKLPIHTLEKNGDTLTVYIDLHETKSHMQRQGIAEALYSIYKTRPNLVMCIHPTHTGEQADLLTLWRKNEILPQRLYFLIDEGKKTPYYCLISIHQKALVETAQARRELKSKGW